MNYLKEWSRHCGPPTSRIFILGLILFCLSPLTANEVTPGVALGAKNSDAPHWFKESFLDFEEDVAEANTAGRRVLLYFHQEGCPYCARLVEESFNHPEIEKYMKQHFDGITINMWGDREVVTVGGQDFTEKTFAAALKVQYTPTLVFLDEQGRIALRLNGYYPPRHIRAALRYVAEHREGEIGFSQYMLDQTDSAAVLTNEDFFITGSDLEHLLAPQKKLAVYFESGDCEACDLMHQRILSDAPTRKLVTEMHNVQLDVASSDLITTPDGQKLKIKDWARALGISYTPSLVFFDDKGIEVMRIGAFMKTFHFQSVYDYVLQEAYRSEPSFQRFISARAEKLREAGYDTDIWGYKSSHE